MIDAKQYAAEYWPGSESSPPPASLVSRINTRLAAMLVRAGRTGEVTYDMYFVAEYLNPDMIRVEPEHWVIRAIA